MKASDMSIRVHEDVLFWAFRYCLQRDTYASADGIRAVISNWHGLTETTKRKILSEIKEHLGKIHAKEDPNGWGQVIAHAERNSKRTA